MLLYFAFLIFRLNFLNGQTYTVDIDTTNPIHTIPDKFISVTIDMGKAKDPYWFGLNFSYVEPLAKALGPAYLRFGGTDADLMVFSENLTSVFNESTINNATEWYFSGYQLEQIANFTKNVGWRLIYDLNDMLRSPQNTESNVWNSTDAQLLINFLTSKGYDNIDFEIGNEPEYYNQRFNFTINGAQVADAYRQLRQILNNNIYKNSLLIGPSQLGSFTITQEFLKANGGDYIDALSFHFYYCWSPDAHLNDFTDPKVIDKYQETVDQVLGVKNSFSAYKNLPVLTSETSSCSSGGLKNASDTFASGFMYSFFLSTMYLNTIGVSARHGLIGVTRQQLHDSIYNGKGTSYALLDYYLRPRPDYWLAFMFNKLVGPSVYNVTFSPNNSYLRLFGGSSKNTNGTVLYGINMANTSVTLDLPQFSQKQVTGYILTPDTGDFIGSHISLLNGLVLKWLSHMPTPNYLKFKTTFPIQISEYSQFFLTIEENQATSCPAGWYNEKTQPTKCIKFINQTEPLFASDFDCQTFAQNATLLSISSAFENSEILQQTPNSLCGQYYIGLVNQPNSWSWTNQDPSNYFNWQPGYPTPDGTKNCALFDAKTGTWTNEDCDHSHCYICEQYI